MDERLVLMEHLECGSAMLCEGRATISPIGVNKLLHIIVHVFWGGMDKRLVGSFRFHGNCGVKDRSQDEPTRSSCPWKPGKT